MIALVAPASPLFTRAFIALSLAELAYFKAIATMVQGFADNQPPKIVLEMARRGLSREIRPSEEELETMLKAVETA